MRHEPTSGTKVPAATDLMFALRHSRPRWSRPIFVVVRFAPKATVRRAAAQRPLRSHLSPATGSTSSLPTGSGALAAPHSGASAIGAVTGHVAGWAALDRRAPQRLVPACFSPAYSPRQGPGRVCGRWCPASPHPSDPCYPYRRLNFLI